MLSSVTSSLPCKRLPKSLRFVLYKTRANKNMCLWKDRKFKAQNASFGVAVFKKMTLSMTTIFHMISLVVQLWHFLAFLWVESEGKRDKKQQRWTLQTESLGSTVHQAHNVVNFFSSPRLGFCLLACVLFLYVFFFFKNLSTMRLQTESNEMLMWKLFLNHKVHSWRELFWSFVFLLSPFT